MKNILKVIFLLILVTFLAIGSKKQNLLPKELYTVYLDGKVIGYVENQEDLRNYVNERNKTIVAQLGVEDLNLPETLVMKKIISFKEKPSEVNDIYLEIFKNEDFTINGYEFILNNDGEELKIYTLTEDVFKDAIKTTIETFVGKEKYQIYLNDNQVEIEGVGNYIENIYLEDEITYRNILISVTEKIFTDPLELSRYLLFSTLEEQDTYKVKANDTIDKICYENEISVEEFLISNPSFRSENSLIYEGQEVVIGVTNPQISVVIEENIVEDQSSDFTTDYVYDDTQYQNYEVVKQEGVKGLERITRNVKTINGVIVFAINVSEEEIIPPIREVIEKGAKASPSIGASYSWTWPVGSGWVLTQNYEWRINPITRAREFHDALDIASRYGAPIYSANNGVVVKTSYQSGYGNYIIINHNNGYYTLYSHNQKHLVSVGDTVPAGALIAYMGSTGMSTGPHLHFELWKGEPYNGGYRVNPWSVFR